MLAAVFDVGEEPVQERDRCLADLDSSDGGDDDVLDLRVVSGQGLGRQRPLGSDFAVVLAVPEPVAGEGVEGGVGGDAGDGGVDPLAEAALECSGGGALGGLCGADRSDAAVDVADLDPTRPICRRVVA